MNRAFVEPQLWELCARLNTERTNNPDIEFHFTSEFKTKMDE